MPHKSNIIISHIKRSDDSGACEIQTNEEHQHNVAVIASSFAGTFGMSDFGRITGMLHDKGKERVSFQDYIRAENGLCADNHHPEEHNHAFVGGKLALEHYGKPYTNLIVNQIISHHSGLHDYTDINSSTSREMPEEIDGNVNYFIPEIHCPQPEKEDINHLSRMLFSCLVDADFLDTEAFMQPRKSELRGHSVCLPDLLVKLDDFLTEIRQHSEDTEVNRTRNLVQQLCLRTSSGEQGFYSLTVPTGGGKTLSSVLWALHHAEKHGLRHIIIAIPYTSIITQTANTLKSIFGEENVLEHHSNYDVSAVENEEIRSQILLATENWDYPIIVTTNVQLFESMFSNKPSTCRKLHNIVNSVIILDEVQSLPTDFLQPIVNALKSYNRLFGVSVLLTTASQPVLNGLIEGCNPDVHFKGIDRITEIVPDDLRLHERLRRVRIEICPDAISYDEVAAMLCRYKKVLCIVNTRKDAKELYNRLPKEGLTLHLSRMMCPAHIRETIDIIKKSLRDDSEKIIRVISTQLVEAGVDIDFPVVFRQEAGLDSILQAAGRCNREGKLGICPTFVFAFHKPLPPGSMTSANNARKNLPADSDWFAPQTMADYFRQLYSRTQTFDKENIAHYLYNPDEMMFKSASEKFRLIDDDGCSIIVNWKDSMQLTGRLRENGVSYGLMKKLAQYMVSVRRRDFETLLSCGLVEEILEDVYVVPDRLQYDDNIGLRIDSHWMEEILMV